MPHDMLEHPTRSDREAIRKACAAVAELLERLDAAHLYEAAARVSHAKDLLDASLKGLDAPIGESARREAKDTGSIMPLHGNESDCLDVLSPTNSSATKRKH